MVLFMPNRVGAQTTFDRIVVFGTSLSDSGNLFAITKDLNIPPSYALDSLLVPEAAYARGGHHLSNGATWVEQLARPLGLAGNVLPAFRDANPNATNYAVAGTRAGMTFPGRVLFSEQVGIFLSEFEGAAPADALYVVEIGSNDVRDAMGAFLLALDAALAGGLSFPDSLDAAQAVADGVIAAALDAVDTNIHALETAGAEKFLYFNVAPIGETPAVQALDAVFAPLFGPSFITSLADGLAADFNAGLDAKFATLSDAEIIKLDVFSILDQIIAAPEDFGLTVVDEACLTPFVAPFACQNPGEYFFWDGIHPTKAGHAIFADAAAIELGVN